MSSLREAVALAAGVAAGAAVFAAGVWLLESYSATEVPNKCCAPSIDTGGSKSCCEEPVPAEKKAEMPRRMREAMEKKEAATAATATDTSPEPAAMPRRMREAIEKKEAAKAAAAGADAPEPAAMPRRMREAMEKKAAEKKAVDTASAATAAKPQLGTVLALAKDTGKSRGEAKAALIAHDNDYEAARVSLLPELVAAKSQCAAGCAIPGVYEPAAKFEGGRPGWMFKKGAHGLGYYHEGAMAASTPASKK